jgi:filamin
LEQLYLKKSTGEYRVGMKFNDQHIPDSPFRVYISPAIGDAHLLEVAQFPENIQVEKPAQFYIRLNGARGDLDARVSLPSIQEIGIK